MFTSAKNPCRIPDEMVSYLCHHKDDCTEHIQVNLPASEADYETGNGEGVWVLVDKTTKKAYSEDVERGLYCGILDNDSLYYPALGHGEFIIFEMRGAFRPVTPIAWLRNVA